jgi:chromosome segregation ATPase
MDVDGGDDGDGGRWLTYAQLAEMRAITRKAAIRMTQRRRWRRQPGNDGTALVLVPEADLTSRQAPSRQTPRQDGSDDTLGTSGLEAALAVLEGALGEANKRAEAAQALAERTLAELPDARSRVNAADADRRAAEARADRAEQAIAGERARADALRERLDDATAELHAAQEAATEALSLVQHAERARRARGRLRRAWAAWRGP